MILSTRSNVEAGKASQPVSLGVKDQLTKEALNFLLIPHETNSSTLIQPSRNIPKAFESWSIWSLKDMTSAFGTVQSLAVECFEFSNLKIVPSFLSVSEGSARVLITGTTIGGTTCIMDMLTLEASADSFPVGTGVMGPPAPGGATEIMAYVIKPQTINVSGLFSIRLSIKVTVGTLNLQMGVF